MRHLTRGVWAAALLLASLAAQAQAQTASAPPIDLLAASAPLTRQGAQKLLVDVTSAGRRQVAVGEFGLIVRSDDLGASWVQSPTPTAVMLTAVAFASERHGWAVGHDGVILATQDGGVSWVRQFDGKQGDTQMLSAAQAQLERLKAAPGTPEAQLEQADDAVAANEAAVAAGPSRPLLAVKFFDATTGFAAGAFGQLFQTEDGGRHWNYIGDRLGNLEGLHLNGLTLTPEGDVLIAAEAGTVFRSRDRGCSWVRSPVGYKGYLYGVLALPGSVLVAYGFNGHTFRSADGGVVWKTVPSRTPKTIVAGTLRGDAALLINEEGQLLISTDSGEAFKPVGSRLPVRRLSSFTLLGNDALLTVGLGGAAVHTMPGQRSKP